MTTPVEEFATKHIRRASEQRLVINRHGKLPAEMQDEFLTLLRGVQNRHGPSLIRYATNAYSHSHNKSGWSTLASFKPSYIDDYLGLPHAASSKIYELNMLRSMHLHMDGPKDFPGTNEDHEELKGELQVAFEAAIKDLRPIARDKKGTKDSIRLDDEQHRAVIHGVTSRDDGSYGWACRQLMVLATDETSNRMPPWGTRRVADVEVPNGLRVARIRAGRGEKRKTRQNFILTRSRPALELVLQRHPQRDPEAEQVPASAHLIIDWNEYGADGTITHVSTDTLEQMWRGIKELAHLDFKVGPRAFRRHRQSLRSAGGMPRPQLRRLGSHTSTSRVDERYVFYTRGMRWQQAKDADLLSHDPSSRCPQCLRKVSVSETICIHCQSPIDAVGSTNQMLDAGFWEAEKLGRFANNFLGITRVTNGA